MLRQIKADKMKYCHFVDAFVRKYKIGRILSSVDMLLSRSGKNHEFTVLSCQVIGIVLFKTVMEMLDEYMRSCLHVWTEMILLCWERENELSPNSKTKRDEIGKRKRKLVKRKTWRG